MTEQVYGGGTIIGLCAALRERFTEAVATMRMETENIDDAHIPPQVINGYLPPRRSSEGPETPFIIVRPKEGNIGSDGYMRAKVRIILGVHSEEFDGHEYALIVFQRLLKSIQEQPTLEKRYQLQYPLSWELFDDQAYPFWNLVATTEWTVPVPVLLPDEGVI